MKKPAATKNRNVRIALVQMSCSAEMRSNLAKALDRIRAAAAKGARIVCLQELFRTEYFCKVEDSRLFDLAEPVPGPTVEAVSKVARREKVTVIASLFERRTAGIYHNTAAVIDADGSLLGKYRKMHIPDDPGFYEKFYFTPGDLGFKVFKTRYADIGVLICWDQWFPEAARLTALEGAEILFYPTAIGWKQAEPEEARGYHASWETVQRGHAVANGVYVAAVNRVGREGEFRYWGQSFIADPSGHVTHRASSSQEEVMIADCDLSKVEKTRREWPFLRDRRIDAYSGLLKRASN
ncbi:MAG: N-carbamoyl-D-amino acid hydrolase [Candidatus Omnitrophica bacterium]|nr:N-carbamoyl-D-amino acid hydrolase [Candidatus Omnitrophota bacterium]